MARSLVVVQILVLLASAVGSIPVSVLALGNTAVQLNGTNQYVTFGAAPALGASTFTLELWFKRTGAGVATTTGTGGLPNAIPLLTKGRGEGETPANLNMNYFLGIDSMTGTLVADFENNAGGGNHPVLGTAVVTSNVWHHAAVTYGAGTWNLYLDGVLDKTESEAGAVPEATSIQHAGLGTAMTSGGAQAGFFAGVIDEARVWNAVRTQGQIQAAKNTEIAAQAGLVGAWHLNDGSGTTAVNSAAAGTNGTLTPTATPPLWVTGFDVTNAAVQLNGTNQYVTFGAAPALGASTFTLELWFKRTGAGVATTTGTGGLPNAIPLLTKGRGEGETPANLNMNYFLGIDSMTGTLVADFENNAGGGNHPVLGTAVVTSNVWHHAAVTYGAGTWNLYLDGVLDKTESEAGAVPEATSIQHAGLGTAMTSGGAQAGFFAGVIDEARVWNAVRTQGQIQAAKNTEIAAQAGLVGAWHLNDGSGTTAVNSAAAGTNGTLTPTATPPLWTDGFIPPSAAPSAPVLAAPTNGATGVSTSPTLDVIASDADSATLSVSFFGRPLASGQFALIGTQSGVASGAHATMAWPNRGGGQTYEWFATVNDGSLSTTGPTWTFHTAAGPGTVVIGVGDIASCTSTGDEQTAAIMAGLDGPVFTTGDNVYETGTLAEFNNCYEPTWGPFKSRTRPVPGNHDWGNSTPGSISGYMTYFGAQATDAGGKTYYSYDLDADWHVVNLDSECLNVTGGCAGGSPQHSWLVGDLAANSDKNVIAVWHKPRFSSGATNLVAMQPMLDALYVAGADLVFVGHDHIYERFQPLDAAGAHDPTYGIRHFTVGTGGAQHHAAGTQLATSQALNDDTYGVLKLVLHPTSYEYQFLPVAGETFTDSGTGTVHDAPPGPGENGLHLGSGGAYVTFGDPSKLDLGTFTIETWFKRTATGVTGSTGTGGIAQFIPLVTHGGPEGDGSAIDANWLLGINDASDVLAADFEDMATGANHPVSGTTAITNDVWHHAAATYDGTTWRLYLDGVLDVTEVETATPRSDTSQDAGLGVMLNSSGTPGNTARFVGVLDETRVWNNARTLGQIRSTVNTELMTGTGGLVARWGMDEGSVPTVGDSIAPLANGTITGSGATRVPGSPFNIPLDGTAPAAPTGLAATPGDSTVGLTWTANGESDLAGYNVYRSTTTPVALTSPLNGGALVASPAYTDATAANGTTYHYVVTAVDDSGNQSTASNETTATPVAPPELQTGLDLGSAGAYVSFLDPAQLDLAQFTIETWFKRTGAGVSNTTGTGGILQFIPLVTHGGPETEASVVDANWLLGIDDATDVLAADFEEGAAGASPGLNHPVRGVTPIANNVWHHAAATYDGTTWRLYLDGRLEAALAVGQPTRSDTTQHAALGVMLTSAGTPGNSARFQGILDEVRVWNAARSQTDIRSGIHQSPPSTGLVARWGMGEAPGTTVGDSVPPDADGTIVGSGVTRPAGATFDVPTVHAGPDQTVTLPASGQLDGLALDDGLPGALTTTWTQVGGGDPADIDDPSSATTAVSFISGNGTYHFRLTASDGTNTVFDEVAITVLAAAPNFGLDFDGSNDHVTFGDASALKLANFTLETWFRRDGIGVTTGTGSGGFTAAIPLITKGRNESDGSTVDMNYFLGIDGTSGVLVADFEEGVGGATPGLNHPVSGLSVIQNGTWYHAAATYDGTTWKLYLNGTLERTLAIGQPVRSDSIQHAGLGTAMNSAGLPIGAFDGVLDEARIWNGARTEAQIQAAMTGPLAAAPGLVARWAMDEGTGALIASSAGTTVNGSLINGPLWVTGTPFVSTANTAPTVPSLVAPANGATGVALSPSLQVGVSDPNGGSLSTSFYGRTAGPAVAEDFTVVVLPDTQHYSDDAGRAAHYRQQTQWIVDNADDLNVVFVSHLGDVVENYNVEAEWIRADTAMDTLDNAAVPNNMAPGNHDISSNGSDSTFYDLYFPPSRYNLPANEWYGGWLGEESGQVQRLNKDNYELFTAGGIDFLVVHIEVDAPAFAVSWANTIIDRYPDRQVIVSTHAFVNTSNARATSPATSRPDGQSAAAVWTNLISPNCNIFMVVNGHFPGEGRLTSNNSCGQPVHQVLSDYQSRANGGDGWLRYYTFKPSLDRIDAFTYSPKLGTFEVDATSEFSLAFPMSGINGFELLGTVDTPSGSTATMSWPGRAPSTAYDWYAVTSDGVASRTSPTWSFTTGAAPSNNPPIVENPGAQTTLEGVVVDLPIVATDPDDHPLSYSATGLPAGLSINATSGHITGTVSFAAAASSPYTTTVTVADGHGPPVPVQFSWTITNVNREPTFDQDVLDRTSAENASITLDAGGTDPDGDALAYAATSLPPGLSISPTTGLITGTIAFTAAPGPYAVSVTVTDSIGPGPDATDTFSWTITNINREPTFDQNLANRTDAENTSINLDAGGTDPDGDALAYAATNLPPGLSISPTTGLITGTIAFNAAPGPYAVSITVTDNIGPSPDATDTFSWTITNTNQNSTFDQDLGDRTDPENASINLDAGATDPDGDALAYAATNLPPGLSISPTTGLITGTIAFTAAPGPYAVSITVTDNIGPSPDATDTFSWTITNVNREPTFDQNLGNRTDAEGAVISIDAGATDPDADALAYAATNLPAGLSISPTTGLITGTIDVGASTGSPYSVSITVTDNIGPSPDATDIFTWTVTAANNEPTFDQDIIDRSDAENASISIDAGATDVDGDPLAYAATNLPPGLSISPTTGLITGTIAFNAAPGPYAVSVTVTDNIGPGPDATDTFSWTITNTNREPTFDQDLGDRTNAENASITLDAGGTDPDGDALAYAATNLPPGLSISPTTGLITGTIGFTAAPGPYAVSITVSDSIGPGPDSTDTFTWTVTNTNREPTFDQNLANRTDAENASINLDAGATDLDGDPLTYAATNLPPGLSISPTTGLITGTIAFTAAPGPYAVSITVTDNIGPSPDATDTFSWTVTNVNREPTFDQDLLDRTDAENALISLDAGATDPDANALAYAATNLPAGLSISPTTGLITGTIAFTAAPGPYAVSITVTDNIGPSPDATDTFSWTVTNVNREPTFDQDLANRTSPEGTVVNLDAGATDLDNDPLTYAATNLPAGLSISPTTGLITGTIAFTAAPGPYAVSITVTDNIGPSPDATDTFSWTVTDVAPGTGIALRSVTYGSNNSESFNTITLAKPAGVVAGDVLLASIDTRGSSTVTAPTGWTLVQMHINGTSLRKSTYVRVAGAAEPATYTWTFSAVRLAAGAIHAYTGVNTTTPIDASGGQTVASSTTVTAPSITTTVANTMLVAFFATMTDATWTPPAGMTERGDLIGTAPSKFTSTTGADALQAAIGATGTRIATASKAANSVAHLIALRPAAGGPPPVNNEPTFDQDLANRTSPEGTVVNLDAGATDLDGDPLTYAATNLPPGLSISPTTGLITGTIGSTASTGSPYAVSITVRDGPTVDATDTFSWTVTDVPGPNNPPTFDQDLANRTSPEGTVVNLDAGATDPDNDPLTYAATNLPAGLSISPTTGLITGTIAFTAAPGPYAVSITVTDNIGPSPDATDTFSWTVTDVPGPNNPPTFDQDLANRTSPEGTVVNLDAGATDLDNDPLTYAATNLPAGLSISPTTGLITGTIAFTAAPGPYAVSITVTDNIGPSPDATDTFSWTVTDVAPGTGIALRSVTYGSNNSESFNTITLAKPAGVVAGDVLLASIDTRGSSTVTAPTGWTLVQMHINGTSLRKSTYVRVAGAAEPATYTWTFSAVRLAAGAIHAYTGVNTTTPIDASGGQTVASSTTVTAPSITTTVANTMLVAFFATMTDATWTPPAGMTERGDLIGTAPSKFTSTTGADALQAAIGATGTRIATASKAANSVAHLIALRPAAGGPPPVNNEPTFDQDLANRTSPEGTVVNLDAGATDPDNDPLTYAATNLPAGLSISPTTGLITGTIAFTAAPGPYAVSITVTDNIGPSPDATDTFSWTVTDVPGPNNPPTFDQDLANRTSPEGTVVNLDAGATDLDNDPLTYAATNLPAGLSISPTTGLITGTIAFTAAPGPYAVSITVTDNIGPSPDATDTFSWTVTDVAPGTGIALRSVTYGSNNSESFNTITLAKPAGVVAGDVLLASIDTRGSSTVTAPTGWTLVQMHINGTSLRKSTYVRVAGAAEPATYTWTFSAVRLAAGAIHAYTGVNTTTPIDASGGQTVASSTTVTAPSITTTVANTMLVAFFATMTDATWTPPAGMTERGDLIGTAPSKFTSTTGADALQAAIGATGTRIATASKAANSVAHLIALRPASP